MAPSLPDLPTEIVGLIGQYVGCEDGYDLRHLRLTCRALEAKTFFQFGHLNFKTVAIDVSPTGFDKLDGICQHPGLRSHVLGLRLDPKFYVHVPPKELDSTSESGSDHAPTVIDPGYGYFDKAVLNFIYRGRMARRLRRSIATLPKLTKLHINPPQATSTNHMLPGAKIRYMSAITSIIKTALDVMCRASIHIAKFQLWTMYDQNDSRCAPGMTSLAPLAAKTELLSLITRLYLEIDLEQADCDSTGSALVKILQNTKKLRRLHLGFDRSIFAGRMLCKISRNVDSSFFSNVQVLGLLKMEKVPSPDLVEFLGKFESPRFELYMVDFTLYPGTWSEIFLYLRHRPLVRLDLGRVREGSRYVLFEKFNAKIGHVSDEHPYVANGKLRLKEWKDGNLGNWLRDLSQLYTNFRGV